MVPVYTSKYFFYGRCEAFKKWSCLLPSSSGIDGNKVDAHKLDHLVARVKREDLHREDHIYVRILRFCRCGLRFRARVPEKADQIFDILGYFWNGRKCLNLYLMLNFLYVST